MRLREVKRLAKEMAYEWQQGTEKSAGLTQASGSFCKDLGSI